MATPSDDTGELLDRAGRGDDAARQRLLDRHRARLRRTVAVRMDRRLAPRVDPSDVVQESLAEAARSLDGYLGDRPIPFYPWLRQFACQRLSKLHRHHIGARRRSVGREEPWDLPLPDRSAAELADRLLAAGTSPSRRLMRAELRETVRAALDGLPPRDREILVLRHLEQLSVAEIAATLGLTEAAVKKRQVRALERLRVAMGDDRGEGPR